MRLRWSLRTCLLAMIVFAMIFPWCFSYFATPGNPYDVDATIDGPITAGSDPLAYTPSAEQVFEVIQKIESDERKIPDDCAIHDISIVVHDRQVEPERIVPLLGPTELRHVIFRCYVVGQRADGTKFKKNYFIDVKNYHLTSQVILDDEHDVHLMSDNDVAGDRLD